MKRSNHLIILTLLLYCLACNGGGEGRQRHGESGEGTEETGTEVSTRAPKRGGRLVIGMQQEPEILNEAINTMVSGVYVCNLLFSKFAKHNDRMVLIPDLITEIPTVENGGIRPDHLTYTYHLRPDARWHDGTPVTAADVAFTYEVMMHPEINVETRQGWDIVERVETPDQHTVVFYLKEVYANFVGDCFYDESVLPKHLLEGAVGPSFQGADFHRRPIGSGPFMFVEWVPGSHIIVRSNDRYYGEGPYLEEIVIRFIPDGNALLVELETGGVMAIDNAPNELLALLTDIEELTVHRNPALFNEHLDLNCEHPVLADRRVRRALALATDREELSRKIYGGIWIPAYADEHMSSPYYCDVGERMLQTNPAAARLLLAEAGWIDRDGDGVRERQGEPLRLVISTTAGRLNRERTQLVLREQYRRVGIELEIKNYHPTVLFASYDEGGILKRGSFDIALYAILTPPDPSTKEGSYSRDFLPPHGQNYSRISNERLTRLLAEGSGTVSFDERKRLYDEVAVILAREVPIIPLLWVTQLDAVPTHLQGYRPNPTQSGDTWNAAQWWLAE